MNLTLTDPQLSTKFCVIKDEPSEAIVSSLTADLAHPETIKYGNQVVKNIYSSGPVQNPSLNTRGVKALVQRRSILDIGTSEMPIEAPITVGLTITAPVASAVTGEVLENAVKACLSSLIHDADATNLQGALNALIRGALVPKGL